jgi:CRP-like cAMP-binding protein
MVDDQFVLEEETIPSFDELLSDLSDHEVERFSTYLQREEFVPGETIFYQNDPSDSLFIIQVGTVEISKMPESEDDEYKTLIKLKDGNVFGELSFLTESDRSASAVASTQVVLYRMNHNDFSTIVEDDPELACKVYDAFLRILAYRLRRTDQRLIDLSESMDLPQNPIPSE